MTANAPLENEIPVFTDITKAHALPSYPSTGATTACCYASLEEPLILRAKETKRVPTGLKMAIPEGYEVQVRTASLLASSHIAVLNAPGTIDSDYRGFIDIVLINHSRDDFTITPGMKVGELSLLPVARASFADEPAMPIFARLEVAAGAAAPHYATEGASGADLRAHIAESITLKPGDKALLPTGLRIAIPYGYEGQIRPRSGLAAKHSITVLDSPATIFAGSLQEISVLLINFGHESFEITPGMRIAQLIICPVARALFVEESVSSTTTRAHGGFGHTGLN
jgi:dUTP pyrophosphatase